MTRRFAPFDSPVQTDQTEVPQNTELPPSFRPSASAPTPAADRLYVFVPIFLPIIVSEFFARLYASPSNDKDALPLFDFLRFAIGKAGMVDVARHILSAPTIYCHAAIEFEEILSSQTVGLLFRDDPAPVLSNDLALFDGPGSEKPQTVCAALYFDVLMQFSLHDTRIHLRNSDPAYLAGDCSGRYVGATWNAGSED